MNLTLAHRAVLAECAREWADVAARTGAADRAEAEAAIRDAYRAAGLSEPKKIVWYGSPLAAAVAATVVGKTCRRDELTAAGVPLTKIPMVEAGRSVREELRTRPWEQARGQAARLLGQRTWARAWQEVTARLWESTSALSTRIREGIEAAKPDNPKIGRQLRAATLDALGGQHDAPWLAAFDGLSRCFPELVDESKQLHALGRVARSAGWWWPYENIVLVAERPVDLHRDDHARLHRGDGPALAFPDGFALHAWSGMPIPPDFVSSLENEGITAVRIRDERNAELRRVMLEIHGYDRYLDEVGAKPLHTDATGTLWRIELPNDEPVVMVEVLNSTPEPDGTSRTYWLRVPPTTSTAREGVAWTFGVSAADYQPLKET